MTLLQCSSDAFAVQFVQSNPYHNINCHPCPDSPDITVWDLLLCKVHQAGVGQDSHRHQHQQQAQLLKYGKGGD